MKAFLLKRDNFGYIAGIAFAILSSFLLWKDYGYLSQIILVLPIIGLALYLLIFKTKQFAFLIIFLLPLSVNNRDIGAGFGLSVPAEPMIALLGAFFILKLFIDFQYSSKILKHPLSILILLHLAWNWITACTSTMPFISIKFVAIRSLFVLVFYFYFFPFFMQTENIKKYLQLFLITMLFVIFYTWVKLFYSLSFMEYYFVSLPFFSDHTIYSACVAILLPFVFIIGFNRNVFKLSSVQWLYFISASFIFLAGLILSYSRAAWLSVFLMLILAVFLRLRVSFKLFFGILILIAGFFVFYQDEIFNDLSANKEVSQESLANHAGSITNISTDVSNKERINRWKCAIRMFGDKPLFGFGPGTYQFQYAPYQKSIEMTRISTTNGDGGESHSEYLKPLSESGFIGFILNLSIILTSIATGMKVFYIENDKQRKLLAAAITLGLFTYFFHGIVNFFLDTDKTSALYWGMMAMLAALSISQKEDSSDSESITKLP